MSGNDSEREARIRDYLDGRLTDDELEVFELQLFRDTALLDDVEATRALRRGLRELVVAPAPTVGTVAPAGTVAPVPHPLRRALPIAASFLLGAALPGLALWRQSQPTGIDDGKVQFVTLESLRGAPRTSESHAIDAEASRVVLQFRVIALDDTADFTIELYRGDALLQRIPKLEAKDDTLSVDLAAARLGAGDYRARIVSRLVAGGERDYSVVPFSLE